MPDYKKLDEIDVVVIDEPWTPEERKAFSEYLKSQKKPDYKKLDEEIALSLSGTPMPKSDRAIGQYIKAHKAKQVRSKKTRSIPSERSRTKARAKH